MSNEEAEFVIVEFNAVFAEIRNLLEIAEIAPGTPLADKARQLATKKAYEAEALPIEWARTIRYEAHR